jgi:ribulose 1,5-bisphosphate synthetase/thiazole synthase
MKSKLACTLALGLLLSALWATPSWAARDVAGVRFDDQLALGEQTLVLNGAGLRVKMIVKVYAVGLYVGRRDATASGLLDQAGAKSVRIVLLRDVAAEQLNEALVHGVVANVTPAEAAGLHARLEELEAAIMRGGDVHKGNVVQIDYRPESGTRLSTGDKVLTAHDIPGEDFYRGLLKIWLGDKPSDTSLRRDLLGPP